MPRWALPLAGLVISCTMLSAAGCGGATSGGITIPQTDTSPPTLTLQVGAPNGPSASVAAGGAAAGVTLASKTGPLNFSASARDAESGVKTVRVTVDKTVSECIPPGACSLQNPGLTSSPSLVSDSPAQSPGDVVSESSVLLDAIALASEIVQTQPAAGTTRAVTFRLTARATNYLGGTSITPALTVTWKE